MKLDLCFIYYCQTKVQSTKVQMYNSTKMQNYKVQKIQKHSPKVRKHKFLSHDSPHLQFVSQLSKI